MYLRKSNYNQLKKCLVISSNIKYKSLVIYLAKNTENRLNLVSFILLISAIKNSNLFLHILDSIGNELLFYSIGSVDFQKYNQVTEALQIYIEKISIMGYFKNKPITAHVLNINRKLNSFFNRLVNTIILISTDLIYSFSYNGCRKKKSSS